LGLVLITIDRLAPENVWIIVGNAESLEKTGVALGITVDPGVPSSMMSAGTFPSSRRLHVGALLATGRGVVGREGGIDRARGDSVSYRGQIPYLLSRAF